MKAQKMVIVSLQVFLQSLDLVIEHFAGEISDLREFTLDLNLELALDKYRRQPDDYAPIIAIITAISQHNHGPVWNPN